MFFFKRKSKLDTYMEGKNSTEFHNEIFKEKGIEELVAHIFVSYAHHSINEDKSYKESYGKANKDVVIFETFFFDLFFIAYLIDNDPFSKTRKDASTSVINFDFFKNVMACAQKIFQNYCDFDEDIFTERIKEYSKNQAINPDDVSLNFSFYLSKSRDQQFPFRNTNSAPLINLDIGLNFFEPKIRHTTMHKPLIDCILFLIAKLAGLDVIYEKSTSAS